MTIEIVLIIFLVLVIVSLLFSLWNRTKQGRRITDIEVRLSEAVPISVAYRASLIKKLTHVHTPELDELMTRIDNLSGVEEERFAKLLQERVVDVDDPEIDDEERDAALILPIMNRRVRADAIVIGKIGVQVVLVPPSNKED